MSGEGVRFPGPLALLPRLTDLVLSKSAKLSFDGCWNAPALIKLELRAVTLADSYQQLLHFLGSLPRLSHLIFTNLRGCPVAQGVDNHLKLIPLLELNSLELLNIRSCPDLHYSMEAGAGSRQRAAGCRSL